MIIFPPCANEFFFHFFRKYVQMVKKKKSCTLGESHAKWAARLYRMMLVNNWIFAARPTALGRRSGLFSLHQINFGSLFVCLFVCLSVCLFVCLSVCLLVCLSVCLSVCPSVRPSQNVTYGSHNQMNGTRYLIFSMNIHLRKVKILTQNFWLDFLPLGQKWQKYEKWLRLIADEWDKVRGSFFAKILIWHTRVYPENIKCP